MLGQTISHYKILEKLGEGGMGVVYKAEDTRLLRTVALKFLPPSAADPETSGRFLREAQTASSLDHPNICSIHEIDQTPDGRMFIVMPCYEGESLRDRIDRGPMKIEEAISVAIQIASGLSKAHERGIVHRDIKPENIFLTTGGLAKILDFGIAKLAGGTKLTRTGVSPGTAAYMSPEQLGGGEVDGRSDIWALGVVMYEMLTGEKPFRGDYEPAIAYSIMHEEPKPVAALRPEVPGDLEEIVGKAIRKDPNERHRSSEELTKALSSLKESLETEQARVEPEGRENIPSIAVLPFVNMSPDPENQYFGDGLAEELINALAQIEGLRVAARTSAFRFRGEEIDLGEVGRKLKVSAVLEGSVRKAGNRLRVTAQLINIADGYHLWSKRFDSEMRDVFDIQDEIARGIVDQLRVKLVRPADRQLVPVGTENLEAYTAFLQGRYHLHSLTPEGWAKSHELFQKSIQLDPSFALPHAWLSDYYQSLAWWGNLRPNDVLPKSRAYAQKAIELDDSLAFAHSSFAVTLFGFDWDFEAAEKEFQRAMELDPTSAWTRMAYAIFLGSRKRKEETMAQGRLALKLDPLDGLLAAWVASAMLGAKEIDESIDTIERAIAIDQEHWQAHLFLGFAHLHASREADAAVALEKAVRLSGGASVALAVLGATYFLLGKKEEADELAGRLAERSRTEFVAPRLLACFSIVRGDKAATLDLIERAVAERDLFLATENMWPPQIAAEGPEIDALLKRAGIL